ncbi:carbohydrate binding family 9 domain-containing protein [Thalassotalea agarivorans]|uniref:carbohydrate binding family 9 domain-containing protein n=1 Tax=Thalassotalea agarivorans TaxID=349064 RepID=UPI0015A56494|nr:carbohydrate binding family 9 domain-containing protein [Thalassotalea agarivorans]
MPSSSLSAVIDGELDDEIWSQAKTISLDIVNDPFENTPSPVVTSAKLVENGEFLYLSFVAKDPEPSKITAAIAERDSRWDDDLVGIKLDTTNSRRHSYVFLVNPYGVQMDSTANEITGADNRSWDGIWYAEAKLTDEGFQVEMAIPFRILNIDDSKTEKTWAFELLRLYPRDQWLRISNTPLDRNNACWLCQYPTLSGLENISTANNLTVTPALVAEYDEQRDVYANEPWQSDTTVEAGIDLKWSINSNNLVNLTVNPDFSTVESDSSQLSVNKNFALQFEEKRPFFLENQDYFVSNMDLVYTRNIADPDYGAKITGADEDQTYAAFVTNDTQTNIVLPGNLESNLVTLEEENHSAAVRYRRDFTENLSLGVISTMRSSETYHNVLGGIDGKWQIDDSNAVKAQFVYSDTEDSPSYSSQLGSVSDQAIKVDFIHDSEYWRVEANHQQIGKDFRADLGFVAQNDIDTQSVVVNRRFYFEESSWYEGYTGAKYAIKHNESGELIEKTWSASLGFNGPLISTFDILFSHEDKVGLRFDDTSDAIDGNTNLFTVNTVTLEYYLTPSSTTYFWTQLRIGDEIDYVNNRLADVKEGQAYFFWDVNKQFNSQIDYGISRLDADNAQVYTEQFLDLTLVYNFSTRSYIKLKANFFDVEYNPNNYPVGLDTEQLRDVATQLIYAYKINPQTAFYLGYSDYSIEDDFLPGLKQAERTIFSKLTYAFNL